MESTIFTMDTFIIAGKTAKRIPRFNFDWFIKQPTSWQAAAAEEEAFGWFVKV